jgi:5-methylcytosine-specific restriction endonuclease McrA
MGQIKPSQRQRLLERSGGFCEKCHQRPDWRGLSVDHIKNRGMGGSRHIYTDSELQILCGLCHDKKTLNRS